MIVRVSGWPFNKPRVTRLCSFNDDYGYRVQFCIAHLVKKEGAAFAPPISGMGLPVFNLVGFNYYDYFIYWLCSQRPGELACSYGISYCVLSLLPVIGKADVSLNHRDTLWHGVSRRKIVQITFFGEPQRQEDTKDHKGMICHEFTNNNDKLQAVSYKL